MNEKEIKEFGEQGFSVLSIDSAGKLDYVTNPESSNDYCDSCEHLRLMPDTNYAVLFREDDKKAICMEKQVVMYRFISRNKLIYTEKPLYCPKLGRELTDDEELIAMKQLEAARLN